MRTELLKVLRKAENTSRHLTIGEMIEWLRESPSTIGRQVYDAVSDSSHVAEVADVCGRWEGWPTCECSGCNCNQPATCTDDAGTPTCEECQDYTCDDDGNVFCCKCAGVETVTVSCGAGNQTRSYLRVSPPDEPEEDSNGEYACYWETVGNDSHIVSRHTTENEARQACDAKDWPRPGDSTKYLCGYGVRRLVDGQWQSAT